MNVKVALIFLITFVTLFLNSFAIPVDETKKPVVEVSPKNDMPPLKNISFPKFHVRCPIVCDTAGNEPICGTDGKDYTSPKELTCLQMCGHDIQVAYYGKCGEPDYPTSLDW